jgi:hypothetical protein
MDFELIEAWASRLTEDYEALIENLAQHHAREIAKLRTSDEIRKVIDDAIAEFEHLHPRQK